MTSISYSVEAVSATVLFSVEIVLDFTVSSAWGESGTLFDSAKAVPFGRLYLIHHNEYSIATEFFMFGEIESDYDF